MKSVQVCTSDLGHYRVFNVFVNLTLKLSHEVWNRNIILEQVDPLIWNMRRRWWIHGDILIYLPLNYDIWKYRCVGSIGNFLRNNAKSPHSWNLLPPTHLLMKNKFLGFLLHSIIEIKSCTVWRASSPSQCFLQKSTNVS